MQDKIFLLGFRNGLKKLDFKKPIYGSSFTLEPLLRYANCRKTCYIIIALEFLLPYLKYVKNQRLTWL